VAIHARERAGDGVRRAGGEPPGAPAAPRVARAGAIAWQLIGLAVLVVLAGWALGRLMPVLLPFSMAVLLTALLAPVARRLERGGAPPFVAAGGAVALLLAVMSLMAALVVPPFVSGLTDLGANVEQGARQVAYSVGADVAGMDRAEVDREIDQAARTLRDHIGGSAWTGATTVAGVLGAAVLIMFVCFFLLKDGHRLWTWLLCLAPEPGRPRLDEAGRRSWRALTTYMRGVICVATIDATLIGIALVVMGIPLAVPLIVLTWFAAFFPIVGAIVAGAAAVLVALVAQGLGAALVLLAVIVAVQQLEGNVLYPVVVGPRLKLHPIAVLLAVTVGGTIAGIAGAFLAMPVATVAATVLEHARER
jgi:putative heme transporter